MILMQSLSNIINFLSIMLVYKYQIKIFYLKHSKLYETCTYKKKKYFLPVLMKLKLKLFKTYA